MAGNTLSNRYLCKTCGEIVPGINLARKHSRQGHRTDRDAAMSGDRHSLVLIGKGE